MQIMKTEQERQASKLWIENKNKSLLILLINRKTAKTFLAASVFLELLKTFGDIDSEVRMKRIMYLYNHYIRTG